ncbi:MAG: DUF5071 domain-containing protein [Bacilli bacterium]|mgnify:CR=1 FL=1|jgi:hypothetical protein
MDITDYVPKDSLDSTHINDLDKMSDEEIEPIIPALLAETRHLDWPVTEGVLMVLSKHQKLLTPLVRNLLQPFNEDNEMKYIVLSSLLPFFELSKDNPLLGDIKRIASAPTDGEKDKEADFVAQSLLEADGFTASN